MGSYDVIVIGAGHAGCEAALAAARMGCRTLVLTLNLDAIALMPCNPSIGGPAKGHLVREIDALGGQMALTTDSTLLQIRTLNTSKGPAVQTYRAQVDKRAYQTEMRYTLEQQKGLDLKQAMVEAIVVENGRAVGVTTTNGAEYRAPAVIVTTGVYMDSRVITGESVVAAGPNGQVTGTGLARSLAALGLRLGRFKTGTPPRVDMESVDVSRMEPQYGDTEPIAFSFITPSRQVNQLPCWLTYTNESTHALIRSNIDRAPLFNGSIKGVGPRYCPSVEDKVMRFPEKSRHQVFIEPEGRNCREMYVMGMSTSLPEDIQVAMLRTMAGLEQVEVVRAGYAIEYDYVDPTQLRPTLEYKAVPGLFAAGQVNGTSGYEEAAAQGLLAGINAAQAVKGKAPVVLDRSQAYIGVLIDDLTTKGTMDPYRMLTSRAEYRLRLRHGNADFRLTEIGRDAGLVNDERMAVFARKKEQLGVILGMLGQHGLTQQLKRPEVSYEALRETAPELPWLDADLMREVETVVKFEGYLERQDAEVARFKRLEGRPLPREMDYLSLVGLSTEAREKLDKLRPESVGSASRISGVTPADISVLLIHLEKRTRMEVSTNGVGAV